VSLAFLNFSKCDEIIDYDRLASRSERVHFYESLDFYEDELADNGICICDVRFVRRERAEKLTNF
jgi:hypothetical protein